MSAIISLTTIPDRIGRIGPTIESLVAQELPVYLWAVKKISRSDTVLETVPNFPGAIVEVVEDRGPITKLLPALEIGVRTIITADDDMIYGDGWAVGLLNWSRKLPGAVVCYRGRILCDGKYSGSKLVRHYGIKEPVSVDIATGVYGALYWADMFDDSICGEWQRMPTNDDLVIAAHLKKRGTKRYVVPSKCRINHTEIQHIEPLFKVNRRKGDEPNDRGVKRLGLG